MSCCYFFLLFFFFFFLMIRRPPRSTLFPYTRSSDLGVLIVVTTLSNGSVTAPELISRGFAESEELLSEMRRSEEHTSELQSRVDLVCRLLLEKKKKTIRTSLVQE